MTNPYQPPESGEGNGGNRPGSGKGAPWIGCGLGGCLVPLLLFLACGIFLGDVGGPLFWPFIAAPLGGLGMAIGYAYRSGRK